MCTPTPTQVHAWTHAHTHAHTCAHNHHMHRTCLHKSHNAVCVRVTHACTHGHTCTDTQSALWTPTRCREPDSGFSLGRFRRWTHRQGRSPRLQGKGTLIQGAVTGLLVPQATEREEREAGTTGSKHGPGAPCRRKGLGNRLAGVSCPSSLVLTLVRWAWGVGLLPWGGAGSGLRSTGRTGWIWCHADPGQGHRVPSGPFRGTFDLNPGAR